MGSVAPSLVYCDVWREPISGTAAMGAVPPLPVIAAMRRETTTMRAHDVAGLSDAAA
jgi:hypothetical protein